MIPAHPNQKPWRDIDLMGVWCMVRMNRVVFETKAIIIKNVEGNEKGKA